MILGIMGLESCLARPVGTMIPPPVSSLGRPRLCIATDSTPKPSAYSGTHGKLVVDKLLGGRGLPGNRERKEVRRLCRESRSREGYFRVRSGQKVGRHAAMMERPISNIVQYNIVVWEPKKSVSQSYVFRVLAEALTKLAWVIVGVWDS